MKVLFINSVCGIRSTGRIVSDLADHYMSQGHEVKIAYGREAAAEKYAHISYRIGTDADVKINALKARLLDNDGFNALRQTKKFIEFANDYNPDVLWLHNLHGYYINIDLLFDWIKQRPEMRILWTLHDCWSLTGHCAHFDYAKCSRWKDGCGNCPQKNVYPASWILDRSRENYRRKKAAFCGVEDLTLKFFVLPRGIFGNRSVLRTKRSFLVLHQPGAIAKDCPILSSFPTCFHPITRSCWWD